MTIDVSELDTMLSAFEQEQERQRALLFNLGGLVSEETSGPAAVTNDVAESGLGFGGGEPAVAEVADRSPAAASTGSGGGAVVARGFSNLGMRITLLALSFAARKLFLCGVLMVTVCTDAAEVYNPQEWFTRSTGIQTDEQFDVISTSDLMLPSRVALSAAAWSHRSVYQQPPMRKWLLSMFPPRTFHLYVLSLSA